MALASEVEVLRAALIAIREMERHTQERAGIPAFDPNACKPCMKFAVQVALQGVPFEEAVALRCATAREWHRQITAAYALIDAR